MCTEFDTEHPERSKSESSTAVAFSNSSNVDIFFRLTDDTREVNKRDYHSRTRASNETFIDTRDRDTPRSPSFILPLRNAESSRNFYLYSSQHRHRQISPSNPKIAADRSLALGLCTSLDFIAFTSLTCVAMHAVLPSPPLRAQLSSKINSIFTGAWRSSSAVNARQSLCRRNASAKRRFEVEISKHLREHVDTRICLRIHIALSMS